MKNSSDDASDDIVPERDHSLGSHTGHERLNLTLFERHAELHIPGCSKIRIGVTKAYGTHGSPIDIAPFDAAERASG
ncbi:hypothetical protein TNCV_2928421 [Trichonephila clavipes]|nr:hypothetical protein TNCV_2928421 [Trichonephila clavipes]